MNDSVGVPGHRGQTTRILILAPLIVYPSLNASRALRARSGHLILDIHGRGQPRNGKQRGFVSRRRFYREFMRVDPIVGQRHRMGALDEPRTGIEWLLWRGMIGTCKFRGYQ